VAIEVLTGVPGSGKTTRLVETLRAERENGRRVVTFYCRDMPNLEANTAVSVHRVISARAEGLVFPIDHVVDTTECAQLLAAEEPGTLVAFEEAQWFTEALVPAWVDADDRGLDVLLTTPSRRQLDAFDRLGHRYGRTHLRALCSVCERREAGRYFRRGGDDDSLSVCKRCARRLRREVRGVLRRRIKADESAAGKARAYPVELRGFRRRVDHSAELEWDTLKKLTNVAGLPQLNRSLSALVLGSDTGFICHRLRRWGFGTIVGVEEDRDRREVAELVDSYFHRDHASYVAMDPCRYVLDTTRTFDLVFATGSLAQALASRPPEERAAALTALRERTAALCVVAAEGDEAASELRAEIAAQQFARVARLDAAGYDGATLVVGLTEEPEGQQSRELAQLAYPTTVARLRSAVDRVLPEDATVVVLSHGDEKLVQLAERRALHFPQAADGSYVGSYPATSGEAVDQLRKLCARGARYLVIPAPQLWWLDYYGELREQLTRSGLELLRDADAGVIFQLLQFLG
jgi:hypothetical protein